MLNIGSLPNLPQSKFLEDLLPRIWADESVIALWLGGSLAYGRGDAYSDVDLRLAVTDDVGERWRTLDLTNLFHQPVLAQHLLSFAETAFLHHLILASGEIYDLYIQTPDHPLSKEKRLIFGCRDQALLAKLQTVEAETGLKLALATPDLVQSLVEQYWIIVHKGQKVNYRGLRMMNWEGLNLMRAILMRLLYIQATGDDCGDLRNLTIHAWTPIAQVMQESYGETILTLLGQPTITKVDVVQATDTLNEATGQVGRTLANQFGVDYPQALEAMVLQCWVNFAAKEMRD